MANFELRQVWIERLQELLRQQTCANACCWEIPGEDESLREILEELQGRLTHFIPLNAQTPPGEQVALSLRGSSERTILWLSLGREVKQESWIARWWFSLVLAIVAVCGISKATLGWALAGTVAIWIGGSLLVLVWISYVGWQLSAAVQIFRVRVLRHDLLPDALAADEADCWPFETHEEYTQALALRSRHLGP